MLEARKRWHGSVAKIIQKSLRLSAPVNIATRFNYCNNSESTTQNWEFGYVRDTSLVPCAQLPSRFPYRSVLLAVPSDVCGKKARSQKTKEELIENFENSQRHPQSRASSKALRINCAVDSRFHRKGFPEEVSVERAWWPADAAKTTFPSTLKRL